MVKTCCVIGCCNKFIKNSGIHFFKFPFKNPILLKKWLSAINRENFVPKDYHYVCSAHFKEDDNRLCPGSDRKFLKDQAVPTIFPSYFHCQQSASRKAKTPMLADRESKLNLDQSSKDFDELDLAILEDSDLQTDTEGTSETGDEGNESSVSETCLRSRLYQDKLYNYTLQLKQLIDGTNLMYLNELKKLETAYKERLKVNQIWKDRQVRLVEKEFIMEKDAAVREMEGKLDEIEDNLIQEIVDKKKNSVTESVLAGKTGDPLETRPSTSRKSRRRTNDPASFSEKRRGKFAPRPANMNFLLDDKEIEMDLKAIQSFKT